MSTWKVLCTIVKTSLPIMAGFTFMPAFHPVNLAILGKWEDTAYLEAYGLATMMVTLTHESVGVALSSCLETLVAQAYGADDFQLCRMYLNRQFFINTVAYAVLLVPLFFAEDIFTEILG